MKIFVLVSDFSFNGSILDKNDLCVLLSTLVATYTCCYLHVLLPTRVAVDYRLKLLE